MASLEGHGAYGTTLKPIRKNRGVMEDMSNGYRRYSKAQFDSLRKQHNVMALVGNGFDIQVLTDYEQPSDTKYATFYHYLKFRQFDNSNLLLKQMESLEQQGKENWSDLEACVAQVLETQQHSPEEVQEALQAMQKEFSSFLNQVAPPSLLDELGTDSMEKGWAVNSLSKFIQDFDLCETADRLKFPTKTNHYDLYNFMFVNFNYTPLLDGYVYLDQNQFDPRPWPKADRHFEFLPNPSGNLTGNRNADTIWSSYVLTEVIHPHGFQSIPRSLLFGIDAADTTHQGVDPARKLMKPFWARNNIQFAKLFPETELFIIFGCSIGESDGWWWRRILEALSAEGSESELIIYSWYADPAMPPTRESVCNRFLSAAEKDLGDTPQNVLDRIHIILYHSGSERVWLNTSENKRRQISNGLA